MSIEYLPCELNNIYLSYLGPNEYIFYNNEWDKFSRNNVCNIAAEHGWLDLLKWARDPIRKDSCPWNRKTCAIAALNGHLDMLIFARDMPNEDMCQWDYTTCENAALNGHIDILKFVWTQTQIFPNEKLWLQSFNI